jgi:hypothetical protein
MKLISIICLLLAGSVLSIVLAAGPHCDPRCSTDIYNKAGTCLDKGRCLCKFGWTGPNAQYVASGPNKGQIVADFCSVDCPYTPDHQNPDCLRIFP